MRETAEFAALFTPFALAGKRLRNRITHASMSLLATPDGRVTDRLIQYHANRAAGGAAMTVTEPLVGSTRSPITRRSVDLPQPDGPISAVIAPGSKRMFTPLTA